MNSPLHHRPPRLTRFLAGLLSLCTIAALLGACGSSDDDSGAATSAAAAPGGADAQLAAMLPEDIKQAGQITFGALWETPPVISVDPKDTSKPIGLTPDLAAAVTKLLGVKAVWKNMQWPAQLPGVQSGNVDALWGQVTDTRERERSVVDLVAYSRTREGLLLPADNPHKVSSMAEMCGLRAAIPGGSVQSVLVKENSKKLCTSQGKPAIKNLDFPGAQNAIVAVKAGNADAWIDNVDSLAKIAEESNGTFIAKELPEDQVDAYVETTNGIAVSKSQPKLSEALAAALKKLVESGEYGKIMEKWGSAKSALTADEIKINTYTGTPPGQKAGASATSTTGA